MFSDRRSKRVVIVAHCILNQNALSDGTACLPGCMREVIDVIGTAGVGMLQMPCPELICLGLARRSSDGGISNPLEDNTRIRALMKQAATMSRLRQLAQGITFQIAEYQSHGFEVCGILGINRSPTCGVDSTTVSNREVEGRGVFITVLGRELEEQVIELAMVGIKSGQPKKAVRTVQRLLGRETVSAPPHRGEDP